MTVQFDALLTQSQAFDTQRATELLRNSGFIQGILWDGSPTSHSIHSIKLPTDGYAEVSLRQVDANKSEFNSIIMRDRTGKEVPGMTSDFNVVREVLAFIAGWENEKIEKYCFWNFEGQITQSDFAYLWYGAVDSMESWVGLATTKFDPAPARVAATKKYFKDKIKT